MEVFSPAMLQTVDEGSRESAASAFDALCVARAEAEGGDVAAANAAIQEAVECLARCGYTLRFDPVRGCHEVQAEAPRG